MNDLAPDVGWNLVIGGLALLALLLFLLAVRFGRWGIWLAGYLCVVLALAVAMFAGQRRAASVLAPGEPAAVTQPSDGSGVFDSVDRTGQVSSGTPATDEVI